MLACTLMLACILGAAPQAGTVQWGSHMTGGAWHHQVTVIARGSAGDAWRWQAYAAGRIASEPHLVWLPVQGTGAIQTARRLHSHLGLQFGGPGWHVAMGDLIGPPSRRSQNMNKDPLRGARLHMATRPGRSHAWITLVGGRQAIPVAAKGLRFAGDAWSPPGAPYQTLDRGVSASMRLPRAVKATVGQAHAGITWHRGQHVWTLHGIAKWRDLKVVQATWGRPTLTSAALPGAKQSVGGTLSWQPPPARHALRFFGRWSYGPQLGAALSGPSYRTALTGRMGPRGRGIRSTTSWHQGPLAGLRLVGGWGRTNQAAHWQWGATHQRVWPHRAWHLRLGTHVVSRRSAFVQVQNTVALVATQVHLAVVGPLFLGMRQDEPPVRVMMGWQQHTWHWQASGSLGGDAQKGRGPTLWLALSRAL